MDGENNGKPYFLMDDLGVISLLLPSTELTYPTWGKGESENHSKVPAGRGYVSPQKASPK